MSVAEKLTTISKNMTRIYNAGYAAGQSAGGNSGVVPELSSVFADNTWGDIVWACQNNAVPDSWAVGDEKTMAIDGYDVVIAICGKDHDEYVDGGIAPLTFTVKTAFMSAPLYDHTVDEIQEELIGFYPGLVPYNMTDYCTTILPGIIQTMPVEVQAGLRAVRKPSIHSTEKKFTYDVCEKLWLFSENEVRTQSGQWSGIRNEGETYPYVFAYCKHIEGYDISFFTRTYSSQNYNAILCCDQEFGCGSFTDEQVDVSKPIIFGFCF